MTDVERGQRLLIGHGALVLLFGFAVGFGFLFFLIGEVSLWPIPGKIEYQLPGTYDAWRMAHMEGIANGLLLWILAAVLPTIATFMEKIYRIALGMVVVAWTIVVASLLDPLFPDARGLMFSAESNVPNAFAFFLFYVGIVLVIVIVSAIAIKALRTPAE